MSTSVKEVSNIMNTFFAGMGNGVKAGNQVSFQDVWSNQGKQGGVFFGAESNKENVSKLQEKAQPGEELKLKGSSLKSKSLSQTQKDELDEEDLEKAMEVLQTSAQQLLEQIAEVFGLDSEELQQIMADLNMDAMDVWNPEMLQTLLLKAGGAESALELLTNEELYADFQGLMDTQKEMLAQLGGELELVNSFAETTLAEDFAQESFDIDITVEEDAALGKTDAAVQEMVEEGLEQDNHMVSESSKTGREQNGEERSSDFTNGQTGNLVLDTMKADAMQAQTQQVLTENRVWDVDTQNIMRQIMDYMKIHVKQDMTTMELQLYPEHLGNLQVQIASKGGVLTANFVTENEAVKAALESQMIQLKESFADQGIRIEAIEVMVQTHEFERNLEQGRGRQQDAPEKKSRMHRRSISALEEVAEADSLTEEELTIKRMEANGSTVDYTA